MRILIHDNSIRNLIKMSFTSNKYYRHHAIVVSMLLSIFICVNVDAKYLSINSQIKIDRVKLFNSGDSIPFDTIPQMHNEKYYFEAYDELFDMFDGTNPYDLLRAEYLLENAYFEGKANYSLLATVVKETVKKLKTFIVVQNIQGYKTAVNAALFYYFANKEMSDF